MTTNRSLTGRGSVCERLRAFPDSQSLTIAGRRLKLRGARGAWRGDAELQQVSFEFVDAGLGLSLVRAGSVEVVDGFRRLRGIAGEVDLQHHLRTGVHRGLVALRHSLDPLDVG